MKEWIELLSKPSWIGVVALAILGALYLIRMALDFFKSTILPRAYEQRLRRRQIFLPMVEKVLDSSWNVSAFFRDGDPKFTDFKSGCVFARPELAAIRSALNTSRYAYIQGPPSSGKTVVGLNVAYEYSQAKRTTLYFDRPSLLTDQFLEFVETGNASRLLDRQGALLIVDDVHLDVARVSRLFSLVYTNYAKLNLLFISRPLHGNELETDESVYYDFSRYMTTVEIRSDAIIEPLADFYSKKRFGHGMPPTVLRAFMEECGSDLLLLGRYLREWTGSTMTPLPEIRKKVIQAVLVDLEKLRILSPDAVSALLVVSMFYRFEVPVERAFLESHLALQISILLARGELKEQNGFILLYHSSLAKLYTNVCSSLRMPEYETLSAQYSPMPDALFAAYVDSEPRNICEFIVGIRKVRKHGSLVTSIVAQTQLHEKLRTGLERERNLNLLGWAILVIFWADRKNGWRVIKELDLSNFAQDLPNIASPGEISLFLLNLKKVSQTKGAEFLEQVPPAVFARTVESMNLGRGGALLGLIRIFSQEYVIRVAQSLDPIKVCQQVLNEGDLEELKLGLIKLSQLLGDRVCVKVGKTEDAFGETLNRLSFYFDTTKVVRFLKGSQIEIPYGVSSPRQQAYWQRLYRIRQPDCGITVDDGAVVQLLRGASLFPAGLTAVKGSFQRGDVVTITDLRNVAIGFGVSNFDSNQLRQIRGMRSSDISLKTTIEPNRVMDNDLTAVGKRFFRIQEMGQTNASN